MHDADHLGPRSTLINDIVCVIERAGRKDIKPYQRELRFSGIFSGRGVLLQKRTELGAQQQVQLLERIDCAHQIDALASEVQL